MMLLNRVGWNPVFDKVFVCLFLIFSCFHFSLGIFFLNIISKKNLRSIKRTDKSNDLPVGESMC